MSEVFTVWIAAILTLTVYSYLLADNPLYRLAEHLFVGSSVGYVAVVILHNILRPRLLEPLAQDAGVSWPYVIPLLLGLLLLTKARTSIAWLGNSSVAFLFGVGAALAIGGALLGSLLPQIQASWVSISPATAGSVEAAVDNVCLAVGTIGTLAYFYFTMGSGGGPRNALIRFWATVGKWVMLITFGAIFGNRIMGYVSLLIERAYFLLGDWLGLVG
ncbi:MAG: hypothetical protein CEE40_04410 [Chloroflexi bacterium B3_Chlor]|nr:MAG: hypothetical protein CEE40_04410 [Chloroflexi bacterium B3_Chlor]